AEGHAPPKAQAFQSPANWWSSLTFTPDSGSLLSAWKGLWRYDLATGAVMAEPAPEVPGRCYGIPFTPDGERLGLLTRETINTQVEENRIRRTHHARASTWNARKQTATSWMIEVNHNIPNWSLSPDCETVAVSFQAPGQKDKTLDIYA